jgi:hypothetical protein
METVMERPYKVVRTLPDGQQVLIGTFSEMGEARKRVAAFSEYWPGDYAIEQPNAEHRVDYGRM